MTFVATNCKTGEKFLCEAQAVELLRARLTVEDVAALYQVDTRTVQRWQGKIITFFKIGGLVRTTQENLLEAERNHPFLVERRKREPKLKEAA